MDLSFLDNIETSDTVFPFVSICLIVFSSIVIGFFIANKRLNREYKRFQKFTLTYLLFIGITTLMTVTGWIAESPMPRLMIFFFIINVFYLALGLSRFGATLAFGLPIGFWVLFLSFRLPLELILHIWGKNRYIPETMTWSGYNFDFISGLAGLLLFSISNKYRALAWFANILGFIFLLNVMRVAVMSSPLPFAWDVFPHLTLALHFPFSLIATVCVGGALLGHIVLTRALLRPIDPMNVKR